MNHPIQKATKIFIATMIMATLINLLMEHTKLLLYSIASIALVIAVIATVHSNKREL